ncbi:MAG: efflux RND transporter periplasmic adaptor subunit [Myxococcota bacterium]
MTNERPSVLRRILGFGAPIGLGIAALLMMQRARTEPPRRPPEEQGRAVRVLEVVEIEAVPRATGYGVVRSSREWTLVAEVSGRVIELNEQLEDGRIIRKGEPLIKIDPTGFELSAVQQKATVANARAQLAELNTKESNTRASLKIAQRTLELTEKDLERVQALERSGSASPSEVDDAEVKVLNQRQTVQSYKNTLAEIPSDRRALRAQIEQYEAGVETAELDVARTEIEAPFDIRIRSANVDLSELVTVGATLAEGDGIDLAEVPAQFSIGSLQPLFPRPRPEQSRDGSISPRALGRRLPPAAAGLSATVVLESGQVRAQWDARFDRFANVDSDTRTVSIVVAVDEPYARARPGRPPLISGMYVEVQLRGIPRPGCRAVPRAALRDDALHVVTADHRLEIRPVEVAFVQNRYACIESGVEVGESVVLTELAPAIEGMLLEPRADDTAAAALRTAVTGEEDS